MVRFMNYPNCLILISIITLLSLIILNHYCCFILLKAFCTFTTACMILYNRESVTWNSLQKYIYICKDSSTFNFL